MTAQCDTCVCRHSPAGPHFCVLWVCDQTLAACISLLIRCVCLCVYVMCAAGGLNESLLMQLGKLPRLTAAGADTDAETGSDATDVGELDAMDVS
jgi:hypothetical protein